MSQLPGNNRLRFPQREQLILPCIFERLVPGQLHPDGKRYLPLIVLRPAQFPPNAAATSITPPDLRLGVVDRHHVVDEGLVGATGVARLVCALSTLRLQQPPYHQGMQAEASLKPGHASTAPVAFGQVCAVISWETTGEHLAHPTLYTELLLDLGIGMVGVRTNIATDDLAAGIGKARLEEGDWISLMRSRIDILDFVPQAGDGL